MIKMLCSVICLSSICYAESLRDITRANLLKQVDNGWAINDKTSIVPEKCNENPNNLDEITKKLQSIVFPKINFNTIPLCQALQVLMDLSEAYDFEGKGVNLVLIDPLHRNPEIQLNVKNISLWKTIQFLAQSTNTTITFENDAVIFKFEQDLNQQVLTKFFPITRSTVLQILQYSKSNLTNENEKVFEETQLKQFFEKIGISFSDKSTGFAYDGTRLIITQTQTNLQKIASIINSYNNILQVAIEAKFLEVQQGALEDIGLNINFGNKNKVALSTNQLRSPLAPSSSSSNEPGKNFLKNNLLFGASTNPFLNATTVLNRYEMGYLMRALEQRTDSDLMSSPQLTVLSGRKAEIIVAQELRYPESYRDSHSEVGHNVDAASSAGTTFMAGTPEKFITKNVGVEMSVTPVVENSNRICLELAPCVTEFEGFIEYGGENMIVSGNQRAPLRSGFYQPIFSKRQIKTEVVVQNGSTVVMGGLTREEVKETNDKVPFLGDTPLLGNLFKSKSKISQKRNLLIFVTAHLLDSDGHFVNTEKIM